MQMEDQGGKECEVTAGSSTGSHCAPPSRRTQGRSIVKLTIFSVLISALGAGLILEGPLGWLIPPVEISWFQDAQTNTLIAGRVRLLAVAAVVLLLTFLFAHRIRLRFLSVRRQGAMRPFFAQPQGGRWEVDGWGLGLVMMGIIGVVAFIEWRSGGFDFSWTGIALAVLLAASNAFGEEVVFRLPYVTMGANETSSRVYGLVMGSLVFGILHYWGGMPSGVLGAVLSILTGYVLTKSMQETRGFFWAFTIHFMLDLPLFLFMLNAGS